MQRYRADKSTVNMDGSVSWHAHWRGGPSLSKIGNCRIFGTAQRLTVYVTGEADTYFSIPACTRSCGKYVRGYLTSDDDGMIFHAMDVHKDRLRTKATEKAV